MNKELIERLARETALKTCNRLGPVAMCKDPIRYAEKVCSDFLTAYLAEHGKEAVAWMSPGKERLEFSHPDTVYGSHTLPLFLHQDEEEYHRGTKDGWEACETCHGIVNGILAPQPAIPEGMSEQLAIYRAEMSAALADGFCSAQDLYTSYLGQAAEIERLKGESAQRHIGLLRYAKEVQELEAKLVKANTVIEAYHKGEEA